MSLRGFCASPFSRSRREPSAERFGDCSPLPYPLRQVKIVARLVGGRAGRFCRSSLFSSVRPFFGFFWLFVPYLCFVVASSFLPAGSVVPSVVSAFLAGCSSVGFSGSRSALPAPAVSSALFACVPASASVSVGCARGFDSAVRACFPASVVWSASSFGRGRSAFARRSASFVSALAVAPAPVLVSAPAVACPAGLVPSRFSSRCFAGFGSGSWAGVALAVGLGVPVVLFLPAGVVPPASFGFVGCGGGFFLFRPPALLF